MPFARIFARWSWVLLACSLSLAASSTGCGRGHEARAPSAQPAIPGDSSTIPAVASAELPIPAGPQVGRSDSLLNQARPELQEWAALWHDALPGFAIDSLWREDTARWSPPFDRPADPEFDRTLAARLLSLPSPDSRHVLVVDSYVEVSPDADTLDVGREPDSQPTLAQRRTKTLAVVAFCGTSCGFDWGRWLSNDAFVLGGSREVDGFEGWRQGTLAIYSLRDSSATSYVTRAVPAAAYERYDRAWYRWLLLRYRALRPRRA